MATASFVASADRDALVFQAEGDWLLATAAELDRRLRALELPSGREVVLDLAGVERLDTAGAWLLKRTDNELAARGNAVTLANVRTNLAPLLEQVWTHGAAQPLPHPVPAHHTLAGFVARIGEVSVLLMRRAYSITGFFGLVMLTFVDLVRHPRRLRLPALVAQMEQVGVNAMPIVGLLSFLIGVVFAYQGADQLRRFGAEIYTVNLLGIAILRELGVPEYGEFPAPSVGGGHEIVEVAVVRPDHADLAGTAQDGFGILEKSRRRNEDRAVTRQLAAIRRMDEQVAGDFSVFNEWHRPAP